MDLRRLGGLSVLLGLTLMPLPSMAAGKCERLVVTGSPDAPPYLWRDPQDPTHLIGASAELLQHVAQELGIKVELLYAGKRSAALDEVRSGRMDMLADAPLTVNELETLDYIHPPLLENDFLVWTRKGSTLSYSQPSDLHGHTGALSERARLTPSFEAFAKEQLSLTRMPNLTQAFQKLLLGRWSTYWLDTTPARPWPSRWAWPTICWHSRNPPTNPACSGRLAQLRLQRPMVARTVGEKDDRIARVRSDGSRAAAQSRALEGTVAATCQHPQTVRDF